jgi:hypothetical protein
MHAPLAGRHPLPSVARLRRRRGGEAAGRGLALDVGIGVPTVELVVGFEHYLTRSLLDPQHACGFRHSKGRP